MFQYETIMALKPKGSDAALHRHARARPARRQGSTPDHDRGATLGDRAQGRGR